MRGYPAYIAPFIAPDRLGRSGSRKAVTSMTKRNLLITTILIVLSAAVTFQVLNSATNFATARPMVTIPHHTSTLAVPTAQIVPSSVMDPGIGFFEGTGDASAGHWGGP